MAYELTPDRIRESVRFLKDARPERNPREKKRNEPLQPLIDAALAYAEQLEREASGEPTEPGLRPNPTARRLPAAPGNPIRCDTCGHHRRQHGLGRWGLPEIDTCLAHGCVCSGFSSVND